MSLTPMTAERYLHSTFEPEAEFANGFLEERNTGTEPHSRWQSTLMFYFASRARDWNLRVRPILRIKVSDHRYRVPDLALLDASVEQEDIPTHPPLAVFEVLSPEDRFVHTLIRLADFEAMGVPAIYFIDPEADRFFRFHGGSLLSERTLTISGKSVPVQELIDLLW